MVNVEEHTQTNDTINIEELQQNVFERAEHVLHF